MFEYRGKRWLEVKKRFYPLATVYMDTYNKETGECRVDFIKPFDMYSIKGKLLFKENNEFPEIIVNDMEKIYLKNFRLV